VECGRFGGNYTFQSDTEIAALFLEQKAKAEIGWKEAYTYPCAYPECGANPDPVPTPWR
jgi:hypothetical protein